MRHDRYCPNCFSHLAFRLYGHETPVMVGMDRRIHCYSYIRDIVLLEWVLESQGKTLAMRENGWYLGLFLNETDTSLDGENLACRAVTSRNSTFKEVITLTVIGKQFP